MTNLDLLLINLGAKARPALPTGRGRRYIAHGPAAEDESTRMAVLRLLAARGEMTTAEIASALNLPTRQATGILTAAARRGDVFRADCLFKRRIMIWSSLLQLESRHA